MVFKHVALLVFSLAFTGFRLIAQTGDGGGVQIMNITLHDPFNTAHKPETIISPNDTALKVIYYILSDDDKHRVVQSYQPGDISRDRIAKEKRPHLYIPYYILGEGDKRKIHNQRLVLSYRGDTMTVDLIGIPGFDANGFTDMLEMLEFYPHSHIRLYRDLYARHPELRSDNAAQRDTLHKVMRKGLGDSTFFYLRDWNMLEDMTYYKQVVLLKNGAFDTTKAAHYPVYMLRLEDVSFKEDKKPARYMQLQLSDPPIVTDSGLQFRLVLGYYFPFKIPGSERTVTEEERKATDICTSFSKDGLYINGAAFSGTIMFYYNSFWDTVSARGGTYGLIISTYKDGKLVRTRAVSDVDSIYNDRPVVRPTGF